MKILTRQDLEDILNGAAIWVPVAAENWKKAASCLSMPLRKANEFGETIIAENVVDDARAEHIVRALPCVSRNDIAAVDHALELRDLRRRAKALSHSKALLVPAAGAPKTDSRLAN